MSDLLFLASDYIERMANPIYGAATNDDYALRFATLLRSHEFEQRLNEEISSLTDPATLTSYGWLWLFGWATSKGIELEEDLLVALYQKWSSVFVRAAIVDLATQSVSDYSRRSEVRQTVESFPNRFLSRIMSEATRSRDEQAEASVVQELSPDDMPPEDRVGTHIEEPRAWQPARSTALAESTLIALLQVGKRITIDAAAVLLQEEWDGQEQLLESFRGILKTLDAETQAIWERRLIPPSPASQNGF